MELNILKIDPNLSPYKNDLLLRMENLERTRKALLKNGMTLLDFANAHLYYGFHRTDDGWYYREWAPGAEKMYLTGDFNNWDRRGCPMEKKESGVFEVFLPGRDALKNGQKVAAIVISGGQEYDRIPAYAHYVVQDPKTIAWNAVIHEPEKPYRWTDKKFVPQKELFIYECHIGMAQEDGKVGSYREFTKNF